MNQFWYVVHTCARAEKKVQKLLQMREMNCYLPVQTITRLWSDRKKKIELPVMPGYLFVELEPAPQNFLAVKTVPGVVDILSFCKQPYQISSAIFDQLSRLITDTESECQFTYEQFSPGARIRIVRGKLSGLEGELIERNGEYHLLVRLDGWGSLLTRVAVSCVEMIR